MLYDMSFEWFLSALLITGPTYAWLLGGAGLRRVGWLDEELVELAAKFSFRIGMPLVLFFGASRVDYSSVLQSSYLLAAIITTLIVTVGAELWGRWRGFDAASRSVFVQGSFRSNLGIIGISLCAGAYGEAGLALAALPVAVLTILYNIIAVYILNRAHGRSSRPAAIAWGIVSNPLIIGISFGVLLSVTGIKVPLTAYRVGEWVSALVIPAALLTIGASLSLKVLRESGILAIDTMAWRHLLAPSLAVGIALGLGVYGPELGVVYLLMSSPIAAASFVMVLAVGGNGPLAANLIVVSTLVSGITTTLGMALLTALGLV